MLSDLFFRLRALFRRRVADVELNDELRFHYQQQIDKLVASGLSHDEAARQAHFAFGGMDQIKEQCRDAWGTGLIETLGQDIRYGLRMLRKNLTFTFVAVITLAVGIGANTAIFSVVDAVLLHPLPYAQADGLVMVWENVQLPHYHNDQNTPSPGNFVDWKNQNSAFTDMGAMKYAAWNLTESGDPIRVFGEAVSPSVFTILQVQTAIGRVFTPEEDHVGSNRVVLLGHSLWLSRFGGDPAVVGRSIQLDDQSYTVVGVMPADFRFPDPSNFQLAEPDDQIWTPIAFTPEQLANHGSHYLRVLARLKPGITVQQAQSQIEAIARRVTEQHPDTNTGVSAQVMSLRDQLVGEIRPALLILLAAVSLVLLMICANVSHLVLARSSTRAKEFAVRQALGANRSRLLQQLITENMLLALLGGGLGLVLSFGGTRILLRFAPSNLPHLGAISLNIPVLLFTALICVVAGFLFGIIPALQSARSDVQDSLRESAREYTSSSGRHARSALVIAETAIGVVVVIGAGLLLRSFIQLQRIPLGFDPDDVLAFRVVTPEKRYATISQRSAFYQRFVETVEALPGVKSAAGISFIPLTLSGRTTGILIEGKPQPAAGQLPFVDFRGVTPGYFRSMEIPVRSGRDVAWSDTPDRPLVGVISQTMAQTFWPNEDAIGRRVKLGTNPADPWITVVGVVGDVHQLQLTTTPRAAIYFPVTQDQGAGDVARDWVVRVDRDPMSFTSAIRNALLSIDEALPISRVHTMQEVVSISFARHQFSLILFAAFAVVALILAGVGLYGMTAYHVSQRNHEIGIRLALGAQRTDVLLMVLQQGLRLACLGVGVGLLGALVLSRLMSSMLYGVTSRDPATFVAVGSLLIVVALVASYVPSRRATRVHPMEILRYE